MGTGTVLSRKGTPVPLCERKVTVPLWSARLLWGWAAGLLAERHGDGLLLAVAEVGDLDLVAGLVGLDEEREVVGRRDVLSVELGDDVAAELDVLAVELRRDVAPTQARLIGRAVVLDGLDEHAALDREVETLQRVVDRQGRHAELGAL